MLVYLFGIPFLWNKRVILGRRTARVYFNTTNKGGVCKLLQLSDKAAI